MDMKGLLGLVDLLVMVAWVCKSAAGVAADSPTPSGLDVNSTLETDSFEVNKANEFTDTNAPPGSTHDIKAIDNDAHTSARTSSNSNASPANDEAHLANDTKPLVQGTAHDSSTKPSFVRMTYPSPPEANVPSNTKPSSVMQSSHQADNASQLETATARYSGAYYPGGGAGDYGTDYGVGYGTDYGNYYHSSVLLTVSNTTEWGRAALSMLSLFQAMCQLDYACDSSEWNALPTPNYPPCRQCLWCHCDDMCYEENACCIEKVVHDSGPLVATPQCHNRFLNDSVGIEYFLMVDDCPDTWQDQSVSSRCVNASISDLHGQWPVESSVTGSVYRNEHCARCHREDETTLERWDLQVLCKNSTRLQNTSHLEDLVREIRNTPGCHLAFRWPPNSRRKECRPFSYPARRSCQLSSPQDVYSMTVFDRVCHMLFGDPPSPNLASVSHTTVVCALCSFRAVGRTCVPPEIDTPFPLVLLISSKALQIVSTTTGSVSSSATCGCGTEEVFDPYESRCRQLRCPMTKRIGTHHCLPLARQSIGLSYQLTLRLTPRDATKPLLLEDISFLFDTAWNWFQAVEQHSKLVESFQIDLFTVTFHLAKSKSLGKDDSSVFQTGTMSYFEMEMKVVNNLLGDVQGLEDKLFDLAKTRWIFSLISTQELRQFDAAIVYPHKTSKNRTGSNTSRAQQTDKRVVLLSSSETHSDYLVDLTGEIRHFIEMNHHYLETLSVDGYEPVQETLKCPAVSFLLTSPMATEGRDRDPPDHSQHSHSQTADRPGVARGRMLHSVDQDTGQVVVSLDTHTGTLHHKASGRTLSFQHVQLLQEDGVILVCSQQLYGRVSRPQPLVLHRLFSWHMIYVSVACQSLSVVCLFLVFFTYCVFGELRTLPGKNTLGLVTSLLLAMLLFEVGVARVEMPTVCTALGVVIHFCLLSAFTWMVICSAHMYRVFTHVLASRQDESEQTTSLFAKHVTVSLVLPALIVTGTMLGNWLGNGGCDLDLGYGRGICYLSNVWSLVLASVLPICIAVVVNLMLFGATVRSLRSVSRDLKMATRQQRQQLAVYVRMSTLTGINWLVGVITAAIDSVVVWYIFIILCGLQGLYVFVAFVCNKRVFSLYQGALTGCETHPGRPKKEAEIEGAVKEVIATSALKT